MRHSKQYWLKYHLYLLRYLGESSRITKKLETNSPWSVWEPGLLAISDRRPVGKGGSPAAPTPFSQAAQVHFFVGQRFRRLEPDAPLKDHDDQNCWSSWFTAANPVNNNFQLCLYLFFLNNTIFSKTVKFTCKVVSVPKTSGFKFNSLSNIHVLRFAFDCLFSHHTAFNTHEMQSQTT